MENATYNVNLILALRSDFMGVKMRHASSESLTTHDMNWIYRDIGLAIVADALSLADLVGELADATRRGARYLILFPTTCSHQDVVTTTSNALQRHAPDLRISNVDAGRQELPSNLLQGYAARHRPLD